VTAKLRKLKELNESLEPPDELGGVFLPIGHEPRFDLMLVAEMPSMNEPKGGGLRRNYNFDVTARDKFLQEMLVKYGVAGSYLTDVVKRRDLPRRPTTAEIREWLPFLLTEIEIVQPAAIIVLGKGTYDRSFKRFVQSRVPNHVLVDWVFHYSSQVPRAKFERRFSDVIRKIRSHTARVG
jgi:uracil-DNA glycosylase family 4